MFVIQPLQDIHLDKPDGVLIKTGMKSDALDMELDGDTLSASELWLIAQQPLRNEPLPNSFPDVALSYGRSKPERGLT